MARPREEAEPEPVTVTKVDRLNLPRSVTAKAKAGQTIGEALDGKLLDADGKTFKVPKGKIVTVTVRRINGSIRDE